MHLPTVHGFLVFHAFFGDEDVDDLGVGNGAVTFEPLADCVAKVGWRDVEGVESAYFWSLEESFRFGLCLWDGVGWTYGAVPVSVKGDDAFTGFCGVRRRLCGSGQPCWDCGHRFSLVRLRSKER